MPGAWRRSTTLIWLTSRRTPCQLLPGPSSSTTDYFSKSFSSAFVDAVLSFTRPATGIAEPAVPPFSGPVGTYLVLLPN